MLRMPAWLTVTGRLLTTILAGAVVACQTNTTNNRSQLNGYWSNGDAHFSASDQNAVFTQPCETAQFASIAPDSTDSFTAQSTTLEETGNIIHFPDDTLHVRGQVIGDTLRLTLFVTRSEGPVNDPVTLNLTAGGSHTSPVCTA